MRILKRAGFIALMIVTAVCASCERMTYMRFGFDSPFSRSSDGLVIMYAGSGAGAIHLYGTISVSDGSIHVKLIDPDGREGYSNTIDSPDQVSVFELFTPRRGNWRLEYNSINGEGDINLHIATDN